MEGGEPQLRPHEGCPSSSISTAAEIAERCKYIPVRLFNDERKYLRLIRSSLKVSQYTDKVSSHFFAPCCVDRQPCVYRASRHAWVANVTASIIN
jgi:hypothetical protein